MRSLFPSQGMRRYPTSTAGIGERNHAGLLTEPGGGGEDTLKRGGPSVTLVKAGEIFGQMGQGRRRQAGVKPPS